MQELLNEIGRILGIEEKEEMSTADILEILCQITLVLLMVFIIASVLFAARAEIELDAAKKELSTLQGKYDYITKTPKGEIAKNFERALIDLQKQKLLLALEKVVSDARNSFALSHFDTTNKKGEREYFLSDILSEGKIINERFRRGCVSAKQAFLDQGQMQKDLLSRVLLNGGMSLSASSTQKSTVDDPEIIDPENARWLLIEINDKVNSMYVDCCIMQKEALACLLKYYQKNRILLVNDNVNKQLNQALDETEIDEKIRLISEFTQRTYQRVKSFFREQNVPLLKDV